MSTMQTLRRYADAWRDQDLATVLDSYADDVVFHYFGQTDLAGDHVGKEAALEAMAKASSRSQRTLVAIVDVLAGDEMGAIVALEHFERDSRSAELQRVLLYRVVDEHIVECWLYDGDQTLVDQFWTAKP